MKALRTLLAAAAVMTLSATLSAQDINQQLERTIQQNREAVEQAEARKNSVDRQNRRTIDRSKDEINRNEQRIKEITT